MPKNNSSINNSLFDLLKGKEYSPTMLSTAGKEIPTPDEAEVFQFNFVKDGEDYGKVTLTIDDASNLIVYYSDDVADSEKGNGSTYDWDDFIDKLKDFKKSKKTPKLKEEDDEDFKSEGDDLSWYGLLNQLKRFAQRYQLSFELRNTDNLKSDMAKRDYMKKQDQIAESKHQRMVEGLEDQFEFELDLDQDRLYAYDQRGAPAGRVEFYNPDASDTNTIDIALILVRPQYQRQGLASAMYQYLKKQGYNILAPTELTPDGRKFYGMLKQQGVAEGSTGVSVKKWAAQVKQEHGADTKFSDDKVHDRVIARKDKEIVGSYDRKANNGTVFSPKQDMAEGYSLKKTNVEKTFDPGDPDEYTQDVNSKYTDYEIINNKTGQVVGTASWTTNDFMGPGALKITMKNGATRWLDIWEREKGNPQTAFNRFVKDPKTAKKYKEQQATLKKVSPKMREKLRLPELKKDVVESNQQVNEGYYPMGKQGSYSDAVPTTKIIIQHSRRIEEGEQRYRNIAKIFVENSDGERFAVPTNKPGLARVYARHIAEGGTPYDERGRHITSLVEEYSKMSGFMRATRGKQFNESAQQLVTEAVNYYQSLRESLSKMTGHRGYSAYFESWTPALMEDGEEQETNLNELFVQETLDPRIESVMPILGKLQRKLGNIKQVDELAEWADNIIEGDGGQEALNPIGIPEATDVTDYNSKSQGGDRKELLRKYANTKKPKDAEAARRAGASQSELKAAADSTEEIHEGASSHDLQNAILYRVEMRYPELFSKYGLEYVADKALDVASFYAGAEEIGSSDMSAMVNHLVKTLEHEGEHGLDENLDADQISAGQLGPTEKVGPRGAVGKLVGANESVNESEDELARILQMVKHRR